MQRKGPYLGIDFGTASIGLALSDDDAVFAVPMGAINAIKEDPIERIAKIVVEKKITKIIVGMPYNEDMSGSETGEKALAFVQDVSAVVSVPVETVDEYLSTYRADAKLGGKKKVSKADRDALAAQVILQGYLDGV